MTLAKVTDPQISLALPSKAEAQELIERAAFIADQLAELVNKKGWFATVGDKKYLEVEAWQFIGFQAGINVEMQEVIPVLDAEGNTIAYRARANLIRGGEVFSSGIMECGMDSFPTRGKEGREKHKACMSAAQTWAVSKAYRNRLSFIARMAGYEPTPAEEMARPTATNPTKTADDNMCPVHKVAWFKRGKMIQEAHPIEGKKGPKGGNVWCTKTEVLADLYAKEEELNRDLADLYEQAPVTVKVVPEVVPVVAGPAERTTERPEGNTFANKGEVMTWLLKQGITTRELYPFVPKDRAFADLTVEELTAIGDKAIKGGKHGNK